MRVRMYSKPPATAKVAEVSTADSRCSNNVVRRMSDTVIGVAWRNTLCWGPRPVRRHGGGMRPIRLGLPAGSDARLTRPAARRRRALPRVCPLPAARWRTPGDRGADQVRGHRERHRALCREHHRLGSLGETERGQVQPLPHLVDRVQAVLDALDAAIDYHLLVVLGLEALERELHVLLAADALQDVVGDVAQGHQQRLGALAGLRVAGLTGGEPDR